MSTPILISIEGNIGSGKSTLLKRLRELHPEWMFVDEPVESWMGIKNEKGESLLEVFYHNIPRWAYTFQNAAVLSRGEMVKNAVEEWQKGNKTNKVVIMERCVETDRNVFAKMLNADGKLDRIEWTLYEKWYDFITKMVPEIHSFIWIDTDADTCSERIKKRGRQGEEDIPLEYLKNLDRVHHEWLGNTKASVFRSQKIEEIEGYIKHLNSYSFSCSNEIA